MSHDDMIHSYVCRDSLIVHSYVCRDSLIVHSYVCRDSLIHGTVLVYECGRAGGKYRSHGTKYRRARTAVT